MTVIEILMMALALLALLRAARSAILILAGIVQAGQTLVISVASLCETLTLLFPTKKRRRARSSP